MAELIDDCSPFTYRNLGPNPQQSFLDYLNHRRTIGFTDQCLPPEITMLILEDLFHDDRQPVKPSQSIGPAILMDPFLSKRMSLALPPELLLDFSDELLRLAGQAYYKVNTVALAARMSTQLSQPNKYTLENTGYWGTHIISLQLNFHLKARWWFYPNDEAWTRASCSDRWEGPEDCVVGLLGDIPALFPRLRRMVLMLTVRGRIDMVSDGFLCGVLAPLNGTVGVMALGRRIVPAMLDMRGLEEVGLKWEFCRRHEGYGLFSEWLRKYAEDGQGRVYEEEDGAYCTVMLRERTAGTTSA